MNERKIIPSVGIALLLATASFAQQVKTDYDHEIDFGQYKTYSWEKVQTQIHHGSTVSKEPSTQR